MRKGSGFFVCLFRWFVCLFVVVVVLGGWVCVCVWKGGGGGSEYRPNHQAAEHTGRLVYSILVCYGLIGWLNVRSEFYFALTLLFLKVNKMDQLHLYKVHLPFWAPCLLFRSPHQWRKRKRGGGGGGGAK